MLTLPERKLLYAFLASLFHYPDQETLDILEGINNEGLQELFPDLSAAPRLNEENALEEIQAAYTDLFVNRFGGVPAPPYGSVYLDDNRQIMGESSRRVAELYQSRGVALEGTNEPPDYLPVELEFLYFLATDQEHAEKEKNEEYARQLQRVREDFLQELFLPWVPVFCEKVLAEKSTHPLYLWAADLLRHLCLLEKQSD